MSEEARHIVCPNCLTVNRLPAQKDARKAKCGRCRQRLFTGHPVAVSANGFDPHIQRNDIPVVVDFWAEWCGPCKVMAPTYERVTSELEPAIRFLKVDTEAEPKLASRYQIQSIPTVLLFRHSHLFARHSGVLDAKGLRSWLREQHVDTLSSAI
jgi:thioredoxin 2